MPGDHLLSARRPSRRGGPPSPKSTKRPGNTKADRGFTLVEMAFAMVIFSMVLVAAFHLLVLVGAGAAASLSDAVFGGTGLTFQNGTVSVTGTNPELQPQRYELRSQQQPYDHHHGCHHVREPQWRPDHR